MLNFRYNFFTGLFIVFGSVWEFVFWDLICGYRWKKRVAQVNSSRYWLERAIEAERRFRDAEYKSRREKEELESKIRKEREIRLSQRS